MLGTGLEDEPTSYSSHFVWLLCAYHLTSYLTAMMNHLLGLSLTLEYAKNKLALKIIREIAYLGLGKKIIII